MWIPGFKKLCSTHLSRQAQLLATRRYGNNAELKTLISKFSSKPWSHKVNVQGRDLHYVTAGSGPKVLVCIPGTLGFAQGDYAFQLIGLNHEKLMIIGWDPLGQGLSRLPNRDFSGNCFQRDAEYLSDTMEVRHVCCGTFCETKQTPDIVTVQNLKKLGHKKYSVMGWSQGGITAFHLAAQYPENIEKLVVFGTFACIDDKFFEKSQLEFIENWSEETKVPYIKFYGEQYVRDQWEGWKSCLVRCHQENDGYLGRRDLLENVKCPTFILHGDKDEVIPSSYAQYIHQNLPGSKLHIWPNGKHNIHLRHPHEFNVLVEQFLLND